MTTPRVTETRRLSPHAAQVEMVRASLLACPDYPVRPVPYATHAGRR